MEKHNMCKTRTCLANPKSPARNMFHIAVLVRTNTSVFLEDTIVWIATTNDPLSIHCYHFPNSLWWYSHLMGIFHGDLIWFNGDVFMDTLNDQKDFPWWWMGIQPNLRVLEAMAVKKCGFRFANCLITRWQWERQCYNNNNHNAWNMVNNWG